MTITSNYSLKKEVNGVLCFAEVSLEIETTHSGSLQIEDRTVAIASWENGVRQGIEYAYGKLSNNTGLRVVMKEVTGSAEGSNQEVMAFAASRAVLGQLPNIETEAEKQQMEQAMYSSRGIKNVAGIGTKASLFKRPGGLNSDMFNGAFPQTDIDKLLEDPTSFVKSSLGGSPFSDTSSFFENINKTFDTAFSSTATNQMPEDMQQKAKAMLEKSKGMMEQAKQRAEQMQKDALSNHGSLFKDQPDGNFSKTEEFTDPDGTKRTVHRSLSKTTTTSGNTGDMGDVLRPLEDMMQNSSFFNTVNDAGSKSSYHPHDKKNPEEDEKHESHKDKYSSPKGKKEGSWFKKLFG